MNKRLKEMAQQAGMEELGDGDWCSLNHPDVRGEHLERFAQLVRDDEREACAKLCESMGVHPALNVYNGGPEWYQRQKECAEAIRARGEA